MSPAPNPAVDWQELLRIAQGAPLVVERVRIPEKGIAVEGSFAPPQLARLAVEDQIFIAAFLRSHGSIKEMEQVFGVSYPTSKADSTASQPSSNLLKPIPRPRSPKCLIASIAADEAERLIAALESTTPAAEFAGGTGGATVKPRAK